MRYVQPKLTVSAMAQTAITGHGVNGKQGTCLDSSISQTSAGAYEQDE